MIIKETFILKTEEQPDVFIFSFLCLETLFVNLQILRYYSLFPHIHIFIPDFDDTRKKFEEHKRYLDIKKLATSINFIKLNTNNGNVNSAGLSESLRYYFSNMNFKNTIITFQDVWLLDIFKFFGYYAKYLFLKKESIFYDTLINSGTYKAIGNDFMISNISMKDKMINFPTDHPGNYEVSFLKLFLSTNYLRLTTDHNRQNIIHQYGYSSVVGKAHVHTFEEKKHYIKLFENFYNTKIEYDIDSIRKNESKPINTTEPWPQKYLAQSFDDNTAIFLPL